MLPTLYFLTIRYSEYFGEWVLLEVHKGQEKGCFKTEPALLGWFRTKEAAIECAEKWQPLEGVVDSIEVIE